MAGRHQLECVKINSLGIRKKIGSLERHVVQLRMDDYVAPVEKPPKKQTSILSFATECPRGSITYRPSMPLKRPAVKRGPGRPMKKPKSEDNDVYYAAIENEYDHTVSAEIAYETACFCHYGTKRAKSCRPTKFRGSYTAQRKQEIREYNLCFPEASYKDIANAFGIPKTTIFDIIKRNPLGEPTRGRGNKKGAGRPLSYPKEMAEQCVYCEKEKNITVFK